MKRGTQDKIIVTMRNVCKKKDYRGCKETLERMYDHVSKYHNETPDGRAESFKNIIDSEFEEE